MATVRFLDNKVLLCEKKVFFATVGDCPPCPGHHNGNPTPCVLPATGLPTTVKLAASDVENCLTCLTVPTTEAAWDGCLAFNLSDAWQSDGFLDGDYLKTPADHLIQATIDHDGTECLFRLTVSCRNGGSDVLVWQGEKEEGDNPCGTYYRTDGCDTKTSMVVV